MNQYLLSLCVGIGFGQLAFQAGPLINLHIILAFGLITSGFCLLQQSRIARVILFIFLGWGWSSAYSIWRMQHSLPAYLVGQKVKLIATLNELPDTYPHYQKWIMRVKHIEWRGRVSTWKQRALIYVPATLTTHARIGDTWQFSTRLKQPHGYRNPGSWNKQRWFLQHNIQVQGTVLRYPAAHWLRREKSWREVINRWRQRLVELITQQWQGSAWLGVVLALTVGVKSVMTSEQWTLLRQTGTSHLMAISGLHISLIAGWVYVLFQTIGRIFFSRLFIYVPAQQMAWSAAWLAAFMYAALAGFALPTQRALLMLSVFVYYQWRRRMHSSLRGLLVAATVVLVWDPFAIISSGFWLSFGAVGWIFYLSLGKRQHKKQRYLIFPFLISLTLLPLTAYFFHNVSGISGIANLISIPWFSVFIIPGILVQTLGVVLQLPGMDLLANSMQVLLQAWWWLLVHIRQFWPWQTTLWLSFFGVTCMSAGMCVLFAPRGSPGRYLAPLFFLPAVFPTATRPMAGDVWVTVLDVGQGLAVVVQTATHNMLYDTGPAYEDGFDAGKTIVTPFLQQRGIRQLNTVIVSHADRDHSGGLSSIKKNFPIQEIRTSDLSFRALYRAKPCLAGQQWQWDGVSFAMLSPPKINWTDKNNDSCVLKITTPTKTILLPGDIEYTAEQWLLTQKNNLRADILVAPHHGSRTSSSLAFIQAVQPDIVIFSTGYVNRFHFPAREVVARYTMFGSRSLNTATYGAVTMALSLFNRCQMDRACFRHFSRNFEFFFCKLIGNE